jgi:hypothetical protein
MGSFGSAVRTKGLRVKISMRRPDHSVAQRQHGTRIAALLAAALLGSARPAAAADGPGATPARSEDRGGYGVPLGIAYALAPLAAFGIGGALSEAGASDDLAIGVAAPLFLAPAGVHMYHGEPGRAVGSLGSMLGLTLVGTILGTGAGYLENQIRCDPEQDSECNDRGIGSMILGSAIGVVVGYTSNAILDVALNSSAPEPAEPAPEPRAASVWLAPVNSSAGREQKAAQQSASARSPSFDGLVVGLTLSL